MASAIDLLLPLVCCPVSCQPLVPATPEQLAMLNERTSPALTAALVRQDGTAAYPVRDGIPLLVSDEAIPLK